MARYKETDKVQDNLFIPVRLSAQILEGSIAHTIQIMIDRKLDLSAFDKKIKNDATGRPAYNPRILLKLILFAYANGIISSRRIQRFARENLVAMALAENQVPDFTVIADFISGMSNEIEGIFVNVLLVGSELDLLGNTVFALDGCKLPSNAGKENSGTFEELRRKQKKIREKIETLMKSHKVLDSESEDTDKAPTKSLDKLEKKYRKIEAFLTENTPRRSTRNKESQSNMTDNDSAKMKTGHGVIQGYNGQAMVDERYQMIVSAQAFGKGQDHTLLEAMIDETAGNYKLLGKGDSFIKGKTIIADTGYFSLENLSAAEKLSLDAYIPDQYFRKRDIRFSEKKRFVRRKKGKFSRDDFKYNEQKDVVVCPQGQELRLSKGAIRSVNGYVYKRYFGQKIICDQCSRRKDCLRSETSRYKVYQIAVGEIGRDPIKRMIDKIDTPMGRKIYSKRMGIVEPAFANIRIHKGMDHFTLRSQPFKNQPVWESEIGHLKGIEQYFLLNTIL